jgi:hypothetical protein
VLDFTTITVVATVATFAAAARFHGKCSNNSLHWQGAVDFDLCIPNILESTDRMLLSVSELQLDARTFETHLKPGTSRNPLHHIPRD